MDRQFGEWSEHWTVGLTCVLVTDLAFSVLGKSLKTFVSFAFLTARIKWFLTCSQYWIIKEYVTIFLASQSSQDTFNSYPNSNFHCLPKLNIIHVKFYYFFNFIRFAPAFITLPSLYYKHSILVHFWGTI